MDCPGGTYNIRERDAGMTNPVIVPNFADVHLLLVAAETTISIAGTIVMAESPDNFSDTIIIGCINEGDPTLLMIGLILKGKGWSIRADISSQECVILDEWNRNGTTPALTVNGEPFEGGYAFYNAADFLRERDKRE